ncbi:MAG TPA: HTTM domain-containing protein [Vicinamibacteria bacterium]|nr:HTTM domain-containing protein [Vicinamibacteria bacterium]
MTAEGPRLPALAARAFAPVDAASLVCFRVAFGVVMAWEVIRYFRNGWIAADFIEPAFHFKYFGFGWVRPWPGAGMYVHFTALGIAALGIALGLAYRLSAVVFFLGFTYVFLLDQSYYLNHFYLIVLLAFSLVLLPVRGALSLDALLVPHLRSDTAPAWALWLLRAQVGIPYVYGGLAKLNHDWLRGEPIRMWLAERTHLPLLGRFFTEEWMVFAFAYGGLLLDLLIVPFLLSSRSRLWAFLLGLAFHGLNSVLFEIGVFPWLMMAATTIFFPPEWPRRLGLLPPRGRAGPDPPVATPPRRRGPILAGVGVYLAVQVLVPLRHYAYPGNVSWTEEGHRFSWHMRLRDKESQARFLVTDVDRGTTWTVEPSAYLTEQQARVMAGRPDMILQLAHHLAGELRRSGRSWVEVRARVVASLNGRPPQLLLDPDVDLAREPRSLAPAPWILPLHEPLSSRSPLPRQTSPS